MWTFVQNSNTVSVNGQIDLLQVQVFMVYAAVEHLVQTCPIP
jgi:hypothetical protein